MGDLGQGGEERIDGGAAVGVESGRREEIRLRPADIDFRGLKRRVTQFAQLLTHHGLCAVGIGGRNFLSGERKENRSYESRMDSRTSRTSRDSRTSRGNRSNGADGGSGRGVGGGCSGGGGANGADGGYLYRETVGGVAEEDLHRQDALGGIFGG